jgi:hypothetical protein
MNKRTWLLGSLAGAFVILVVAVVLPMWRRNRILKNEMTAVMDCRKLMWAERGYASANHGFYGEPACLARPLVCSVPGYWKDLPPYLQPPLDQAAFVARGYRHRFYPGPSPESTPQGQTAATSSLTSYAYVLSPEEPGRSGRHWFCADADVMVFYLDHDPGREAVANGKCNQQAWRVLMPIAQHPDVDVDNEIIRNLSR